MPSCIVKGKKDVTKQHLCNGTEQLQIIKEERKCK